MPVALGGRTDQELAGLAGEARFLRSMIAIDALLDYALTGATPGPGVLDLCGPGVASPAGRVIVTTWLHQYATPIRWMSEYRRNYLAGAPACGLGSMLDSVGRITGTLRRRLSTA